MFRFGLSEIFLLSHSDSLYVIDKHVVAVCGNDTEGGAIPHRNAFNGRVFASVKTNTALEHLVALKICIKLCLIARKLVIMIIVNVQYVDGQIIKKSLLVLINMENGLLLKKQQLVQNNQVLRF